MVLAVGAGFAPVDRAGLVIDLDPAERHMLAVALHCELLEVGGKTLQILLIRQDRDGLRAEEVRIPDREQRHQHGQILPERRGAEVLVHFVEAVQTGRGNFRTDGHMVERPIAESME